MNKKMKIRKSIFDELLNEIPICSYEIGGILGGKEGIVSEYVLDFEKKDNEKSIYLPDTKLFNYKINKWKIDNISFMGVFHTHFVSENLSVSDEKYICEIMKVMPENIKSLYFPIIVMPNKKVIIYVAHIKGLDIKIDKETLEMICK